MLAVLARNLPIAASPEPSLVALLPDRREPRALISSWTKADWLDVSSAPNSPTWQWSEVAPDYLARPAQPAGPRTPTSAPTRIATAAASSTNATSWET